MGMLSRLIVGILLSCLLSAAVLAFPNAASGSAPVQTVKVASPALGFGTLIQHAELRLGVDIPFVIAKVSAATGLGSSDFVARGEESNGGVMLLAALGVMMAMVVRRQKGFN